MFRLDPAMNGKWVVIEIASDGSENRYMPDDTYEIALAHLRNEEKQVAPPSTDRKAW
jgi:hypothetical protein